MIHFYIEKQFGKAEPFHLQAEFALAPGGRLGIVGPSGSGKSTLLRCLAGLERPDSGFIRQGDAWWYHRISRLWLPTHKRSLGLVFQNYALFPHLSVMDNLLYARSDRPTALALLDQLDLGLLARRKPSHLSGGQQQRVALARALMRHPAVLLMDEPLSALDPELRASTQALIQRVQAETQVATILVSHDATDLACLCDEILELRHGRMNWDRYTAG